MPRFNVTFCFPACHSSRGCLALFRLRAFCSHWGKVSPGAQPRCAGTDPMIAQAYLRILQQLSSNRSASRGLTRWPYSSAQVYESKRAALDFRPVANVDHAGTRHPYAAPGSTLRPPSKLASGCARLVADCGCARKLRGNATRSAAHRLFYRPSTYREPEGRPRIRKGASTGGYCETASRYRYICKARTLSR
jgi:hypothetical protein